MQAFVYRGPGHKGAIEDRPKPTMRAPTDAIVRVTFTRAADTKALKVIIEA
jgi:alcohol dehydrogenase